MCQYNKDTERISMVIIIVNITIKSSMIKCNVHMYK